MKDAVGLTGLQLSILDVLWNRGEATTHDVWETVAAQRPLALTTVATIMSRLERKQIITHRQEGRQFVYRARVSRAEVRRSKVRELTDVMFGGDASALVSHLVRGHDVDAQELARIRALLSETGTGDGSGDV